MEESTLPSPRFDEAAAQQARPVVPLSNGGGYTKVVVPTQRSARPSYLPASKGPWLLAAFVGLILGAGAMAIGVAAYRRNHVAAPPQSLVPAAAATRPEFDQDFRPRPTSRPSAPEQQTVSSETKPRSVDNAPSATAATAPAPKSIKRRQVITSVSSEDRAADNDSSGRPKPRLVDRYIMRSPRP